MIYIWAIITKIQLGADFFNKAICSCVTNALGRETTGLCVLSIQCKFVGRYVLQLSVFLFRAHVIKGVSLLCVSFQNTTGIQNESGEYKCKTLSKYLDVRTVNY